MLFVVDVAAPHVPLAWGAGVDGVEGVAVVCDVGDGVGRDERSGLIAAVDEVDADDVEPGASVPFAGATTTCVEVEESRPTHASPSSR